MTSQLSSRGGAGSTGLPPHPAAGDSENLKAIGFLSMSMALFAIDDMFIKLASSEVGAGQILSVQALIGLLYFGYLARAKGQKITCESLFSRAILLRHASEATGAVCFVIAISLMPISNASAILQASPLIVTFGAALMLRESVGWRRWIAIFTGFAGVMLIVRPGMAGFSTVSLFAVAAAIGLALRDLLTRTVPRSIPVEIIALGSNGVILLLSVILQTATAPWTWMSPRATVLVLIASVFAALAVHLLTIALRIGEISVIAPFRYTRVVVAIAIGIIVFGERPDMLTISGALMVVASGLYTLYREQIVRQKKLSTL